MGGFLHWLKQEQKVGQKVRPEVRPEQNRTIFANVWRKGAGQTPPVCNKKYIKHQNLRYWTGF